MLDFLFKKDVRANNSQELNDFYSKLKEKYSFDTISEDRKNVLKELMDNYGYIPYSYAKALSELTDSEVLYSLEYKWKANNVLDLNGKFVFANPSVLARNNVTNSDWIKREGHNIKLINLAGLGNGNESETTGKFMDWMRQLAILPTGNISEGIFNTTIYLIPFHPREFGCAYLPTSSAVSPNLEDKELTELTGHNVEQQVKDFITLAQLAGHPVIYDILPQTGRYSKAVLSHPYIARWFDINGLIEELEKSLDKVCLELKDVNRDDLEIVKNIYKQSYVTDDKIVLRKLCASVHLLVAGLVEDDIDFLRVSALGENLCSLGESLLHFGGQEDIVSLPHKLCQLFRRHQSRIHQKRRRVNAKKL